MTEQNDLFDLPPPDGEPNESLTLATFAERAYLERDLRRQPRRERRAEGVALTGGC